MITNLAIIVWWMVKVGAVQKQPESLGATSCAFQHDLNYYNGVEHFVRDSPVL